MVLEFFNNNKVHLMSVPIQRMTKKMEDKCLETFLLNNIPLFFSLHVISLWELALLNIGLVNSCLEFPWVTNWYISDYILSCSFTYIYKISKSLTS